MNLFVMISIKKAVHRLWMTQAYLGYCFTGNQQTKYPWHYWGARNAWQQHGWFLAHLLKCLMTISWPFRCLYHSINCRRRLLDAVIEDSQVSRNQLFIRQFIFSLRTGIAPIVFYRFGFYHEDKNTDVPAFLYDHELSGFFSTLNQLKQDSAIDNKYDFFKRCQQHNLPVVSVLAYYKNTVSLSNVLTATDDLFSKPAHGCQGKGTEYWKYIGTKGFKNSRGQCFLATQLDQYFKAKSKHSEMIVQPFVRNHPALAQLGEFPLTARLITARVDDSYQFLTGIVKLPMARNITNNSGLTSAIDSKTGRLGRVYKYRPGVKPFRHHPNNHALVEGLVLPDWQQAKALVCQAHQLFPDFVFLGWDVVFSDNGVFLLEVNQFWEAGMIQLVHQTPLGKTRFLDITQKQLVSVR